MKKDTSATADIKQFINNVIDRKYNAAHSNLNDAVNKKIKRQIINNNRTSIF